MSNWIRVLWSRQCRSASGRVRCRTKSRRLRTRSRCSEERVYFAKLAALPSKFQTCPKKMLWSSLLATRLSSDWKSVTHLFKKRFLASSSDRERVHAPKHVWIRLCARIVPFSVVPTLGQPVLQYMQLSPSALSLKTTNRFPQKVAFKPNGSPLIE